MRSGASSSKREQLLRTQTQLRESRVEVNRKDIQISQRTQDIQQEADRLARTVALIRDRDRLEQELASCNDDFERQLTVQARQLEAEHEQVWQRQIAEMEDGARGSLEQVEEEIKIMRTQLRHEELDEHLLEEQAAEVDAVRRLHREAVELEELRRAQAQEEVEEVRAELQMLARERNAEEEAASVANEEMSVQAAAAQRQDELKLAEVRTRASEMEALQEGYSGLEGKSRSLQNELGKVSYTVGQRDHELQVKDSELQEIRQSSMGIQSAMDEVNVELKEQCSKVLRVEGSLRLSRDLGEKVSVMRDMLKESHGALAQVCGLLEEERSRRERCDQSLRQQRVRTELLLQLLHHFKSRTQDLGPQALLSQVPELAGGSGQMPAIARTGSGQASGRP